MIAKGEPLRQLVEETREVLLQFEGEALPTSQGAPSG